MHRQSTKRTRGGYVLVLGDTHLDVMADYEASAADRTDKIGQVWYSVGGTAFNIAANLGQCGVPVALLSVLRRDAYSSLWVEERLAASNVDARFLEYSDHLPEPGFVAIRRDGELETAVTSTAITHHVLSHQRLDEAVAGARIVVGDCNLSPEQLGLIRTIAQRYGKPIAIAATSDSKVSRLRSMEGSAVDLVFLNRSELRTVAGDLTTSSHEREAARWCALFSTRTLIVTEGGEGHLVVRDDGSHVRFPAPKVEHVVSSTGAGDALAAGVLKQWFETGKLDFEAANVHVASLVARVLKQQGATVSALAPAEIGAQPSHSAGAPMVSVWSGTDARWLRLAKRMSVREFAEHIGVSARMVSKWEAGGGSLFPAAVNQTALDSSLAASSPDVQARFDFLRRPSQTAVLQGQATKSRSAATKTEADVARVFAAGTPGVGSAIRDGVQSGSLQQRIKLARTYTLERPVLTLVAGFAGSGKTEFGTALSKLAGWMLIDKDVATRPMAEQLLRVLGADPNDRHSRLYLEQVRPLEYECLMAPAFDNLRCGTCAVVTAPFLVEMCDEAWLYRIVNGCATLGAEVAFVWMDCDVDTMHEQLRRRGAARDAWKLAHWNEYLDSIDVSMRPIVDHIVIDNRYNAAISLAEQAAKVTAVVQR